MLETIDFQLLDMVATLESKGEQVSTWDLAKLYAKTSADRNKLDGLFRYHLDGLAKKGLLKKNTYRKGKQELTSYSINPKRFACSDGAFFILDDPILIIACKYADTCPSQCNVKAKKRGDTYTFTGCPLMENSAEDLKSIVYRCLKKTTSKPVEETTANLEKAPLIPQSP